MPSSMHDQSSNSDNTGADEHQKHTESQIQSQSPGTGIVHTAITAPSAEYMIPPHLDVGHAMAHTAYPYPDPYYRSIFTPYGAQPMIHPHPLPHPHPQLMGIQAAVPLPSDAVEEPVYVNAKQYHGILRRRQSRAKAESENKMLKCRKPYMHESRHLHALRRARGCGGRFLNAKTDETQKDKVTSNEKAQSNSEDSNKNQNSPSEKQS